MAARTHARTAPHARHRAHCTDRTAPHARRRTHGTARTDAHAHHRTHGTTRTLPHAGTARTGVDGGVAGGHGGGGHGGDGDSGSGDDAGGDGGDDEKQRRKRHVVFPGVVTGSLFLFYFGLIRLGKGREGC